MSAPQTLDSTTPLPVNEQKDVESQSNSETKRLEHPLLYDVTPPTVLVDFNGSDDPYLPMNWPFRKKVLTTFLYGFTTCWITFASAVYSTALGQVSEEFQVSLEVAASGVSLIVFGFGLGPLIWAPLSEVYGRKWVVIVVWLYNLLFIARLGNRLMFPSRTLLQPYFPLGRRPQKTSKLFSSLDSSLACLEALP